MKTRSR